MVKLRDLVLDKMTDEEKAAAKPHPKEARSATDDEITALPDRLAWLKNAKKGGD